MEIGETLYVTDRVQWRKWLQKNHKHAKDIWLIFYKKESGKPFIPYDDAVEEALCFGWIDSIIKKSDEESRAQRFSPRKPNSQLSELNKERIRRMIKAGKMTPAGLDSIKKYLIPSADGSPRLEDFIIPEDILEELKKGSCGMEKFPGIPRVL